MTNRQEDKLSMYEALLTFNQQYPKATETVPALQNAYLALKAIVSAIHSTAQLQMSPTTGHRKTKVNSKSDLSSFANDIAGAIFAWANDIQDSVTMEKVKISYSKLYALRDDQLGDICHNFHNIATANQKALEGYGLTTGVLDTYLQAINNYKTTVPKTRNAVAERISHSSKLAVLFKEADAIIKNKIDKLTNPTKKTDPEYNDKYWANREVIKTGNNRTGFRILLTDAETANPIAGADIVIESLHLKAVTDNEGLALIKPIPLGVYNVVVQKDGYLSQTISEVKTKLGKTSIAKATLTKAG